MENCPAIPEVVGKDGLETGPAIAARRWAASATAMFNIGQSFPLNNHSNVTEYLGCAYSRPVDNKNRIIKVAIQDLLRAMGPTVSNRLERGTTRKVDVRPTVGLIPTILECSAGETIDPHVSVPRDANARPSDVATADPEEDPAAYFNKYLSACSFPGHVRATECLGRALPRPGITITG